MIEQRVERLEQQVRYLQRRLLRESEYTTPDGPAPDPVGFPVLGSPENPVPTPETSESAERTLQSIAAMLGWENMPPRETLEREIAALKARALAGAVSHPQPEGKTTVIECNCEGTMAGSHDPSCPCFHAKRLYVAQPEASR